MNQMITILRILRTYLTMRAREKKIKRRLESEISCSEPARKLKRQEQSGCAVHMHMIVRQGRCEFEGEEKKIFEAKSITRV